MPQAFLQGSIRCCALVSKRPLLGVRHGPQECSKLVSANPLHRVESRQVSEISRTARLLGLSRCGLRPQSPSLGFRDFAASEGAATALAPAANSLPFEAGRPNVFDEQSRRCSRKT